MKTLLIAHSLLLTVTLFANELSWVDEQVKAIKPARVGMQKNELSKIKNPFIFLKKNDIESSTKTTKSNTASASKQGYTGTKSTQNKTYTLTMIINNSFLINKKWYKIGDKIDGYSIKLLNTTSIMLKKRKKKSIFLTTKSNQQKIKFLNN